MKKGKLITLEGIDGCGKSTQEKFLEEHLQTHGYKTRLYREPGATGIGEAIRQILLSRQETAVTMSPLTEYLLFAASRSELYGEFILPDLSSGSHVIVDRSGDSSLAYQGYGHRLDKDVIRNVNHVAMAELKPDLTLLFNIEPETALKRINNGSDRIELNGLEFFSRVRKGYLEIADSEPERFRIIDASGSVEDVTVDVIEAVNAFFQRLNQQKQR